MLFQSKIDRVLNLRKSNNEPKEEKEQLEKGDFLAMLIAAFMVFIPVVLIFSGCIYLLLWVFVH